MSNLLFERLQEALAQQDPLEKCIAVDRLADDWEAGQLQCQTSSPPLDFDIPGRPQRPLLVDPRQVPKRSTSSSEGRLILLHSFAHIEFNAINLALDAAYRFRGMPDQYVSDWLKVAREEASHFQLIETYLRELGSQYGAFPAHNGLWDMVCKTRHDVLHRMALVPRVMEARGLDVTPGMISRFEQAGDHRAVSILQVIYREEVGHVQIGNFWYHYCCQQRELDAKVTFKQLIESYFGGRLRGPFNWQARLEAGFDEVEIRELEQML